MTLDETDMETEAFKTLAADLFGNSWQTRLARALGVDGSSVRRWVSGAVPVAPTVQAFLNMMAERQQARGALAFERLGLGTPTPVSLPEPETLEWMKQKFVFPRVEQAKPIPAILSHERDGIIHISMNGDPTDQIGVKDVSYALVRHPDSQHLDGFLAASAARGFQASVVSHRFHHYSLIAHKEPESMVLRRIHTHSGDVRSLMAFTSDSTSVIGP